MVDSGLPAMVATHIPAWQRLGLKLKKQSLQPAPGAPTSPTDTPLAGSAFRKRKVDSDDDTVITSFDSSKRFKHNGGSMSNSPASSRAGSESHSFSESRRKSVTFSADTKAEDGSSSKSLVQRAYAARLAQTEAGTGSSATKLRNGSTAKIHDKKQSHISKTVQAGGGATSATTDTQKISTPGEAGDKTAKHADGHVDATVSTNSGDKQSAQQRSPKKPSNQPSSKATVAQQKKKQDLAIRYLEEYATARQSWKFNKSRQVAILNMALDIDQLPTAHDEALKSYLEGLQGAASRQRLRGHAIEVIAAKDDTIDSASATEAKHRRAKLVLEGLGPEDQDSVALDSNSENPVEAGMDVALMRKASSDARSNVMNGHDKNTLSNYNTMASQETSGAEKKRRKRTRPKKKRNASSDSDSSSSDTENDSDDSQDQGVIV